MGAPGTLDDDAHVHVAPLPELRAEGFMIGIASAEEARVERVAVRLEFVHREGLAGVEPQVLRVVRRGDAVGAEPVALGDGIERGGEAVRVVPASERSGRRKSPGQREAYGFR